MNTTTTHITELLNEIAAKVQAVFDHCEIKWTVKASMMNRAVLCVEPGWPDNKHGGFGMVGISTKAGSTGNWLIRIHAFERWVKLTDDNLASLVNDIIEYIRCRP